MRGIDQVNFVTLRSEPERVCASSASYIQNFARCARGQVAPDQFTSSRSLENRGAVFEPRLLGDSFIVFEYCRIHLQLSSGPADLILLGRLRTHQMLYEIVPPSADHVIVVGSKPMTLMRKNNQVEIL